MRVEKLQVGQLSTNCYLAWDEATFKAVIIDPGDDADYIIRKIQDFNLQPELIIATHGHFDHVLAVTELKLAFKIPFLLHKADLLLLKRALASAKYFTGISPDLSPSVDQFLQDGDLVKFGQEKLTVLATPGHTPGGISLFGHEVVFTGDTPKEILLASIKNKLFELPDETTVYPGHGQETTIGEERQNLLKY